MQNNFSLQQPQNNLFQNNQVNQNYDPANFHQQLSHPLQPHNIQHQQISQSQNYSQHQQQPQQHVSQVNHHEQAVNFSNQIQTQQHEQQARPLKNTSNAPANQSTSLANSQNLSLQVQQQMASKEGQHAWNGVPDGHYSNLQIGQNNSFIDANHPMMLNSADEIQYPLDNGQLAQSIAAVAMGTASGTSISAENQATSMIGNVPTENSKLRDSQYCLCLAEYYLKFVKPSNPRFAMQCLISALNDPAATLPEKVLANLRLAQTYYKYTENFNYVLDHLELAILFGKESIETNNEKFEKHAANASSFQVYDEDSIIKNCPAEMYAEAVLLQALVTLPTNVIKSFQHYNTLSEDTKKSLQNCLNELATCASWASPKLSEWQVKLAFQMANILYREAEYGTAKEFLNYGIEMARSHQKLQYYTAILSLANAMIYLNQFSNLSESMSRNSVEKSETEKDQIGLDMIQEIEGAINGCSSEQPDQNANSSTNPTSKLNLGNLSSISERHKLHLNIYIHVLKMSIALRQGDYKQSKISLRSLNESYKRLNEMDDCKTTLLTLSDQHNDESISSGDEENSYPVWLTNEQICVLIYLLQVQQSCIGIWGGFIFLKNFF